MAIEDPSSIQVGETIRFKTLSPHDNVIWTGKVSSICDYKIARTFQDVDTYYWDVKKVHPTMDTKEVLRYILLEVLENDNSTVTRVFALEWIDVSTLERVKENTYRDFRVFDIDDSKAQDVLVMLKSHGYVVQVQEN